MLDKNVKVENLDPALWKNFSAVLEHVLPAKRILHILDEGTVVRAVWDDGKAVGLEPSALKEEERLLCQYPTADEIRIYTPEGLDRYDRTIQETEVYEEDIDVYLGTIYRKLRETEGIRVYRRKPEPDHIFAIVKKYLQGDGAYLFWVTQNGRLFFDCILLMENGSIVLLTTSGRYPEVPLEAEAVKSAVEKEFCVPVHSVIMECNER